MTGAFQPRPAQSKILEYTGGPMGISAVPGSGKTFTLSLLAARLVERLTEQAGDGFAGEREVLVVTFTNSAVENFRSRISQFVQEERGLLPGVGYRVRTLHGLAHDILRERPSLVGLAEGFDIVDDRTAVAIKREAVIGYLGSHPDAFSPFILPDYLQNPKRIEKFLLADALDLADRVIRTAKELRLGPVQFQTALLRQAGTWPLLDFAGEIYAIYQRSVNVAGQCGFRYDLIVLALQALMADPRPTSPGCKIVGPTFWKMRPRTADCSKRRCCAASPLAPPTGRGGGSQPGHQHHPSPARIGASPCGRFFARYPNSLAPCPTPDRSAQPIIDRANYLAAWSRRSHPFWSRSKP